MYICSPVKWDETVYRYVFEDDNMNLQKGGRQMQLDDRSNCLLQEVITNPGIKNKDLEEKKYGLSRRQIGYSFDKINDWLEINNLPRIERTRQGLFIVNPILFLLHYMLKKKRKLLQINISLPT
ncbi:hypothetical protein GCM10020331_053520 [Ectobacillus funiculus]